MSGPVFAPSDTGLQLGVAVSLTGLPGMGPRRLRALLTTRPAAEAWELATADRPQALREVLGGELDLVRLAGAWAAAGRDLEPAAELERHRAAGVAVGLHPDVWRLGESLPDELRRSYPEALVEDPEPPAVLFSQGQLECLHHPRVAIVGTRRCTGAGAGLARELGRELAAAGVAVVSGLALGIDGAAHRGVLDSLGAHPGAVAPVGVVGCGLDIAYPSRHRDLWAAVASEGLLLSESPLGARPAPWRFPARNRIIAGLADVVVVVESHVAGGSLLTVAEAITRDVDVMAVPGSVRSSAATGTNQLLADGCHPVRDAGDVLVALGLQRGARHRAADHRPRPSQPAAVALEAFDWEPVTLEHLAVRTGMALPELASAVEELIAGGWISGDGGWYERTVAR